MTPAEIITLARTHFGELTALTVSVASARSYLNAAIKELYEDLPVDRLKPLLNDEAISLTAGKGDIPSNLDRVVEVYVDNIPAVAVPREVITTSDYGNLFAPAFPVIHIDSSHIWVRPVSTNTVAITYLQAPTVITAGNEGSEITEIPVPFHESLSYLVASYMYAQEEDVQQAQWYRNEYMNRLMSLSQQAVAEDGQ